MKNPWNWRACESTELFGRQRENDFLRLRVHSCHSVKVKWATSASAARWQWGDAAVVGPDLGFLCLLNSTGGADALWMGDSGQMWLPTVEGSSLGLRPRLCQFVRVLHRLDAGDLLLLMLMEAVGTFACRHSYFIDTIGNDHTVHLGELCPFFQLPYKDPLCHPMVKVESPAFFPFFFLIQLVGFCRWVFTSGTPSVSSHLHLSPPCNVSVWIWAIEL